MTRLMYDSIDPSVIPSNATMVAYYIDGIFGPNHAQFGEPGWDTQTVSSFKARNVLMVPIAVNPNTNAGIVGDCETGDMTPQTLVSWVMMRRRAGIDPTGYTSFSNWQNAINAFASAAVPQPHWWIADYDNIAQLFANSVAKQYANSTFTGHNYDLSIVADYWPGVDDLALDPNDPIVVEIRQRLTDIINQCIYGNDVTINGQATKTRIGLIPDIFNEVHYGTNPKLDTLTTTIQQLSQAPVDVNALASALANNTTFSQTLAKAVALELGRALDQAP